MVCIGKNIANCSKTPEFLLVMCAMCPHCAHTPPGKSKCLQLSDHGSFSFGWVPMVGKNQYGYIGNAMHAVRSFGCRQILEP